MARTKGALDADHTAKRTALLDALRQHLGKARGRHPSFRDLAAAAKVSQTTLRHYFGGLEALIVAVFADFLRQGAAHLERMAQPVGRFDESVHEAIMTLSSSMGLAGLRALRVIGQAEGVRRPAVGKAYLQAYLDPCVGAVARRLEAHLRRGEMRTCDPHAAALALVAPVVLAYQHQIDLGGSECSPLDLDHFLRQHATGFIRGYGR